jgi:hypothetical protein
MRDIDVFMKLLALERPWMVDRVLLDAEAESIEGSFFAIEPKLDSVAPNAVPLCPCTIMSRCAAGGIWITARG